MRPIRTCIDVRGNSKRHLMQLPQCIVTVWEISSNLPIMSFRVAVVYILAGVLSVLALILPSIWLGILVLTFAVFPPRSGLKDYPNSVKLIILTIIGLLLGLRGLLPDGQVAEIRTWLCVGAIWIELGVKLSLIGRRERFGALE